MLDAVLRLIYPPKCVLCQRLLLRGEQDLCSDCRAQLDGAKFGYRLRGEFLDGGLACYLYEGRVRESIHRYKFGSRRLYAAFYAARMAALAQQDEALAACDAVIPVPTNRANRRRRGFDHALTLARKTAALLDKPCLPVLGKTRETEAMFGLKPAERRANILGAIRFEGDAEQIREKRVLLIDDIFTTGATAGECARVLRMAGAAHVHALTFAKSDRDTRPEDATM